MRYLKRVSGWSFAALLATQAACGGREAEAKPGSESRSAGSSSCPSEQEVGQIIGMPVRQTVAGIACQYEVQGYAGVWVELHVRPRAAADSLFADVRTRAKGMLGQDAEPDRIDLGEGGWAYGSNSMSEAAVVAGGRLYHAQMDYMAEFGTEIGDKKDAMVRLLAKMIG